MKARFVVVGLILSGMFVAAYRSIACEEPPPPPPPNRLAYAVIKTEDNIKYAIVNNSVTLDGTDSNDADGGGLNGITKFEWDCENDGYYEQIETPGDGKVNHTYTQAGTYVARLRVTGNESYDIDTDICCVHISSDSDSDNMPDGWENYYGLNPALDDSGYDPDSDGFTNIQEYTNGTNPVSSDSDDYDIVAELIAKTMRAYQARYRYRDGEDYVPWPNNTTGGSGGPSYPADDYYEDYCYSSHPDNAINLIKWIVNRFFGSHPIHPKFVRDDYWDPTLVKDSGGESCSPQWTYIYYKYNRDPEFENIPWTDSGVTSSNYSAVLNEFNRIITEQFNVRFPANSPYYTSYEWKYGISWYITGCDEMTCNQAQSYPANTCDSKENTSWPSQWQDIPDGISKTPRVKEWTSWMSPFESGYRAEKEVVRGKITCDLTGDTGSADCYVQLKLPYGDTNNYSNIEPDFSATEYWQDLEAARDDSPTTGGVWTSSDYFGDFTPNHTGCYFGWRYGGGVSYNGNFDGSYPRNHHGWELATTVLIEPVFSEE